MKNLSFAKWVTCFILLFFAASRSFGQYATIVAQDGTGNYTSIQAAINAAPASATTPYVIYIKNGTYTEVVNIPSTKPFIQLVGQSVEKTILTYNNGASTIVNGSALGTAGSATLTINANDCAVMNMTIQNTFGIGSQAVAVEINADRVAFKNCRMTGNQDTLYTKGSGNPRHYFRNCYIDGNVDFIFGSSIDIFDSCVIYGKSYTNSSASFLTAANTTAGQNYGYVMRNCIIPRNTGLTSYYLGRPWQNSNGFTPTSNPPQANNKVVYLNCTLGASVSPLGWVTWDSGTDTTKIYDAEYDSKNFDGTLTNVSQRVTWSKQLSYVQDTTYTTYNIFNVGGTSWDPCPVVGCAVFTPDIAISNFAGAKGTVLSTFTWNISWPINGVTYTVYRSSDSIHFAPIGSVTAANDTNINFQYQDSVPPQGSIYYYYVKGTKTSYNADSSNVVTISSAPTITLTGTPGILTQYLGAPSGGSPYSVSGTNLTTGVTITPPVPFEISADGGVTWHNNSSPITLPEVAGILASTNIYVRLNATATGTYGGNIMHTTTGGITRYDSVSGITMNQPTYTETILEEWPFTTNNQDSAAVRAAGVTPSVPVFNNLYSSNGTTVTTVPAYSGTYGEAFSAGSTGGATPGDGHWGTAYGGPGGNLSRTTYQQFTIIPSANYTMRVDSFIMNAAFYGTSSGTSMMVVYSLSNFVSDSTNVYGYGFATSGGAGVQDITLPNQTSGPTANWRLGLVGGGSGVTVPAGDTLTVRVYFTCSSSSSGRYATMLNVIAKGFTTQLPSVIEEWPFTTNNLDSAAVRATGATATVPTLNNLYLSNGTTVTAVPAYSPAFGQALCASNSGGVTTGDGHWSTSTGGPGGNLLRTYYEQFTLTPTANYSMRVDSFILNSGFYGTSSTTTMMVVYSLSNFVSDSTNVYGYGFATTGGAGVQDITLANLSTANTANWRLGLTSTPTGVTIYPGTTMTIRVYFTCSSSSAGRYAELLDVYAKGITTPLPCPHLPGTITASASSICAGQSNVIYSVVKDTTISSYTWAFTGTGATFSSTTDSVTVNYASNATTGIISVVANAACGVSTPSTLPVIVNPLPADSITTANGATNICNGNAITLNGNTGTGYTYQWYLNNNAITGATSSSYTTATAGAYKLAITTGSNCSATSPVTNVTSGGVPATITTPGSATVICGGRPLVLSANSGVKYQWQLNGATVNDTLMTDTVTAAGAYKVIITDAGGCLDTSAAINITAASLPANTVTPGGALSFCAGGNVALSASTGAASYQWLKNGSTAAGTSTASSYTANTSGQYSVVVTGTSGCKDTSAVTTVTVKAYPADTIAALGATAFCAGGSVTLNISNVTGNTYQWLKNGTAITSANGNQYTANTSGTYSLIVVGADTCADTSSAISVTVHPLPSPVVTENSKILSTTGTFVTYSWSFNGNSLGVTSDTLDARTNGNGSYTVTVTDSNGCSNTSAAFTVTDASGVANVNLARSINLYPNPATDMVYISAPVSVNVSIAGTDGRLLIRQNNAKEINISNLASGIYLIMIYDENNMLIRSDKLVKN